MKPKYWYLELFVLLLIFYSIGVHFVELQFTDAEHSTGFFLWSERIVAALFTVEYLIRWIASRSLSYPLRLIALVDLAAILPFYLGFLVDLRALRLIRTLRILRMLKLYRYTAALQNIRNAFKRVRYEFGIIGFAVFTIGWIGAVAIYELERERQPEVFGRLSDALWYVVTTVTTVGYGDKVPVTAGGRIVAVCIMVAGLGLFGTFVSLIGSAFLEELRRSVQPQEKGEPANPGLEVPVPDYLQAMTAGRFDPARVLKAIDEGALNGPRSLVHLESVRLLAVACRVLLGNGQSAQEAGPTCGGSERPERDSD
jgi:voltage-gated potassium channel